jgi:four helix bundle protein
MGQSYRELIAWQKARALVSEIYKSTETFPSRELYGLTSQIRRAAVSVPSNIAEGQARHSQKEFKHFLSHARGSLAEVETQIILAQDLKFLSEGEGKRLLELTSELGRILNALIAAIKLRAEG